MPHLMPVWGLWSEGSLYFSTGPDTLKARNLARDPRCTVSTENAGEAVVLEGLAERVRDKAEMSRVVPQYAAKYGMEPPDPEGNPLIAVRPTRGFGFIDDEEEFVRTATRWIF
jgi:general stress protein 26